METIVTLDLNDQSMINYIPETVTGKEGAQCEESQNIWGVSETSLNIDLSTSESESSNEYEPLEEDLSEPGETPHVQNKKSRRVRKQTSFYHCNNVVSESSEPTTYKEAMKRSDASQKRSTENCKH